MHLSIYRDKKNRRKDGKFLNFPRSRKDRFLSKTSKAGYFWGPSCCKDQTKSQSSKTLKKVMIAKKVVQVVLFKYDCFRRIFVCLQTHKIYRLGIILSDISGKDIVKNSKD